ncbi:MAG: tRNA (adenosine(37)-N6)-dimethylallyltransferase MiaA [Candidatus Buchananbacteria bacterium RBG_13_36_9]|uniref:tRNA dimethylallyltransferase n=1 Tax=Candidatus Buchananbacteria bacterium RBG_13_36_9 TaxID=1797530 RepID=A0A1G1XQ99_9BACT|nr:MAG: tRNA (adenosine(37)-N6)-dimethylallyltransferase MiaA [Candidatus Buchananbacteria bacterium RBG_13_36_9]
MSNGSASPKILVIVGPTASGKTSLSIKLAKKFNGEVISADSRQVYKGMDLGTGKVTKKEMQGIKHYLLDVASPKSRFSAGQFVKLGEKAVKQILAKGKLPIVCGGTGFYIDALLYGLPVAVAPDWKLRQRLEKLSASQLLNKLKRVDAKRAKNIDPHNKRRLIRALEIALKTGAPVPPPTRILKYDVLKIGVKRDKKELRKRIHERLLIRMKQGMVKEIEKLHKQGVSWQKLDDFGLEYRFIARYLKEELSKEEMLVQLETAIWHYAKRQMTWFKRNKEINWDNNIKKIEKLVKKWLFDRMS